MVGLLRQHIRELLFLRITRHGHHTFNLNTPLIGEFRRIRETYSAGVFLHRQPVLADEVGLLHRLQITHDDVLEEPRRRCSLARVVMPHSDVVQQSQRSTIIHSDMVLNKVDLTWAQP